jgi:hypothetical protein
VLALWLPLVRLAQITSFITLVVFTLVNAALWRLKLRTLQPVGIVCYPMWVPVVGLMLCAGLIILQIA